MFGISRIREYAISNYELMRIERRFLHRKNDSPILVYSVISNMENSQILKFLITILKYRFITG